MAVSGGKRVRTETNIAKGGVSISSAAVELAEQRCEGNTKRTLEESRILIIGAGKMGRLLVQHLLPRKVKEITLVNRSEGAAKALAEEYEGEATPVIAQPVEKMLEMVAQNHVVFTCTGATSPILSRASLQPALSSPTLLIDISVPRNIDADANELESAYVYNVDDLQAVVAANHARRRRLASQAEDVLREELLAFEVWQNSLGTIPMISKLQNRAEVIRKEEIRKAIKRLNGLTPQEREVVERLSKGIVNKLLHGPLLHLKTVESVEERTRTVKSVAEMFKLVEDNSNSE
eukprot:CAMPEP_0181323462 /NCGR_PEP_ID=MMETSP1101-20121128/19799_1 /TAXON_ID=46948 /ORGANISM="Rhodomonas abbreviata, Strain Caron Lab Isolate" /LENGTH=290 /DNA_ID=CAMNT_0023431493 /DNA_START=27 /DNA_END=899 /DNA_ORIENTATION=-